MSTARKSSSDDKVEKSVDTELKEQRKTLYAMMCEYLERWLNKKKESTAALPQMKASEEIVETSAMGALQRKNIQKLDVVAVLITLTQSCTYIW